LKLSVKILSDKTGTDGTISRKDIQPGAYTVREKAKAGWICTTKAEQTVTINPGEEKKVYFGNKKPQIITKFEDRNANGVMDAGEQGVAGWTFDIKGPAATTKTTDANGQININDLPAGTYNVTESQAQPDWYNTTPRTLSITVPGPGVYFGNDRYRTLNVFKFDDLNKNGKYDTNERGLEGWEFQVKGIAGQQLTNSSGFATFKVKANERYLVSESLPVKWLNSTPLEALVYIDPASDMTNVSFGDYEINILPPLMSEIKIHVFNDTNRNGEFDAGEPGLPSREVRIKSLDDKFSTYSSITTDSNGDFIYASPVGNYWLEQLLVSNWCTNGEIASKVSLGVNESKTVNFGSYPCIDGNCEYRYSLLQEISARP